MKAFVRILTIVLLASFLAGCGGTPAPAPATEAPATQPPAPAAPTDVPLTAAEQWAKENGFGPYQAAEEDWAAVEAAAKKEGKVVVYSNSSKFTKLLDKWAELYPDIALEGGDTDGIPTKMQAEQEAGNVVGDIWYNSDGHILYGQFVPNEWIWSYMPPGVTEAAEVTEDRPIAIHHHSVDVWGYNQEVHPDGCPIKNWWQLTEPNLAGKLYMENPLADPSTTAKITLIVEHADEMAAAYKDLYGKEWTEDEMAKPDSFGVAPENAGYLFLRKLAMNKPVMEPGGDEVDTAYASVGMDKTVEPGYGLTGWDSYETTLDGELAMAPCLSMEPVIGIFKATYVAVANMAPHPNAAKLFMKFILTQDGYKPWDKIGVYPAADGLKAWDGAPAVTDIKVWPSDDVYAWANNSKVRDFFAAELLSAP